MTNQQNLGSIKELAQQYQNGTFRKIEEYPFIHVNNQISERTCMTSEGKEFTIKEISILNKETGNTERVRMPNSVLAGLNVLLKDNPHLEYFRVLRTGVGMNTRYTVLPVLQDKGVNETP